MSTKDQVDTITPLGRIGEVLALGGAIDELAPQAQRYTPAKRKDPRPSPCYGPKPSLDAAAAKC